MLNNRIWQEVKGGYRVTNKTAGCSLNSFNIRLFKFWELWDCLLRLSARGISCYYIF